MRYFLIFLFLFSSVFGADLSQRLQYLIQDKKVKTVTILKYDPFYTKQIEKQLRKYNLPTPKKRKKRALKLVSILGNRAFIDGTWFGDGDKVDGYKIKKVLQNRVILSRQSKIKILRFKKNRNILNVREK